MVYLVGAGPGDPKLITLKGLECIQKAQVVVYDRLVSPRLLSHVRPDAELIYAGKSPDKHTFKQDEINRILVEKAKEGKVVTRLKGGDPFVFGRGGEEALTLQENGIPFEVVPGITSAIAVPAYAGIPVTHRGLASNLTIVTGNEDPAKNNSSIAWETIAPDKGTTVFLMGMRNLPLIVAKLLDHGKPAATPVAVISWGTRTEQRTVVGTLDNIVEKVAQAKIRHPAIIVVGQVVNLRDKLRWVEKKPLFGKRVVITRARSQASTLAQKVETLGGEPFEFPVIDIAEPLDYAPMDEAISNIHSYNWIIFTSVNGVISFFKRLRFLGKDIRELQGIRISAIGPKTREEIEKYGLFVDYVPDEYRAEAVIEGLGAQEVRGKRILLPRADIARKILPQELSRMGAQVNEVTAYRTVRGKGDVRLMEAMLVEGTAHIITFTSSSTVRNFVDMLGREKAGRLLRDITVACIGPVTAETATQLGLHVDVLAEEYTIDGLMQAIVQHQFRKSSRDMDMIGGF